MQPFLLLKQTVEAQFDPGPVLLHGPNVQLTSWDQARNRGRSKADTADTFSIGIGLDGQSVKNTYDWSQRTGLVIKSTKYTWPDAAADLKRGPVSAKVIRNLPAYYQNRVHLQQESIHDSFGDDGDERIQVAAERYGCFLNLTTSIRRGRQTIAAFGPGTMSLPSDFVTFLRNIIHVPGLRGNPERTYTSSAAGNTFPGTMDLYVASVIYKWTSSGAAYKARIDGLTNDLAHLGLTWKVLAKRIDDVRLQLLVGRMPQSQASGAHDLVSIADVGFGVSQALPVLVALHAATRGQLVYIEQPETHLHPKAQIRLGEVMVAAANRGVRVVVETHSSLLLRSIQTAVAKGILQADDVSLNWFLRDDTTGFSQVRQAELDSMGRFGDWPVDFDEIAEEADWDYLTAIRTGVEDGD